MNLLSEFKDYLLSQKTPASKLTVKNYLSDISKFMDWFSSTFKSDFTAKSVTQETIEYFKKSNSHLSPVSLDRHVSSLRKFFNFLMLEGVISQNPLKIENSKLKIEPDPWHLKEFKNYLYVYNASRLTIKNYSFDVKNFLNWTEKVTTSKGEWNLKEKNIFEKINNELVAEYKTRLLGTPNEAGFSPATINRKLSSLRKFMAWASEKGYLKDVSGIKYQVLSIPRVSKLKDTPNTKYKLQTTAREYSGFPPIRLAQKLNQGIILLAEAVLINPVAGVVKSVEQLKWRLQGKPVFAGIRPIRSIRNLPKEFYAPLLISTKYFPIYKKVIFYLRHKRPKWYITYHSYPLTHYLHIAILVLCMSVIGFGAYQDISGKTANQRVLGIENPKSPPRILSFQGRLTDSSDVPITTKTNLRFAIYDSLTGTGSALMWQEVDPVTPDSDGIFSILLGNVSTMQQRLFAEHAGLWLGVTVGQTPELTPRQQLATVAYAENSETLQGLPPINSPDAGTNNVVLALDSSGNLTIGGTATPTFQATGGQFKLSGNPLLLTTTSGSNGNVTVNPDGTGFIDLQKPIQNSTNNNNVATARGAVEINDMFAILATSSGQTALTVNQNGLGPIISASSSGTAKFTVDNSGNTTITGNFLPSLTANKDLGSTSLRWNNLWVQTINTTATNTSGQSSFTYDPADTTITQSSVFINPTSAGPNEALLGLAIGGAERARIDTEGDASFGFASGTLTPNSNPLTLYNHGTTQIATVDTSGNASFAGSITSSSTGTPTVGYWTRNTASGFLYPATLTDNVGIGTTSPNSGRLQVAGVVNTSGTIGIGVYNTSTPTAGANSDALYGIFQDITLNKNGKTALSGFGYRDRTTISGSGTMNVYYGIYLDAQAGATNNYALVTEAGAGNVGIGTTAPQNKLSVNGSAKLIGALSTTSVTLGFGDDAGTFGWSIGNGVIDSTHNFRIYDNTAGLARVTVDGSGNVGIGITNPDLAKLVVESDGSGSIPNTLALHNGGTSANGSGSKIRFTALRALGDKQDFSYINSVVTDNTSSFEYGRLTLGTMVNGTLTDTLSAWNGKVGIGTTTPTFKLDVLSGTINTGTGGYGANPNGLSVTAPDLTMVAAGGNILATTNSDFAIDKGGSIAFGGRNTTSSTGDQVFAKIKGAKENSTSGNTDGYLAFATENHNAGALVERMRIDSVGNVGIGVTPTSSRLDVLGTANNYAANFVGSSTSGQSYGVNITAGSGTDIPLNINNSTPTTLFRVTGAGLVTVAVLNSAAATTVCRDSSNVLSTCSSSRTFKDNIIYLSDSQLSDILGQITDSKIASFTFKTDHPGETRYGIIAEEAPAPLKYIDEHGNNNLDFYSAQLGYTWAGIKALNQKITSLFKTSCVQSQSSSDFGLTKNVCSQSTIEKITDSGTYAVKNYLGEVATGGQVLASAVIGNLQTGFIDAKEIVADNLIIKNKAISPIAEINIVRTNVITPLGSDKIIIRPNETSASASAAVKPILEIQNASGSAVASIDTAGNATFSGQLSASSVQANEATISGTLNSFGLVTESASVSGTLRTKNLIADNIDSQVSNIKKLIAGFQTSNKDASVASYSAQLSYIDNLNATTAVFAEGFSSLGPASLTDTSVSGQLSVGASLILADNSINVLGGDLNLQPLKQGGISFLSGKIYIDVEGNLTVNGNSTFAGTLFANVLSPIPGSDLVVKLATSSGSFVIKDASGSAVAKINSQGDATFRKLNLSLVSPAFALSEKEILATGSAGIATISAHLKEITVNNKSVTEKSLIYISPVGTPSDQIPFLIRQVPGTSFTVGTQAIGIKELPFNWLIIN